MRVELKIVGIGVPASRRKQERKEKVRRHAFDVHCQSRRQQQQDEKRIIGASVSRMRAAAAELHQSLLPQAQRIPER